MTKKELRLLLGMKKIMQDPKKFKKDTLDLMIMQHRYFLLYGIEFIIKEA